MTSAIGAACDDWARQQRGEQPQGQIWDRYHGTAQISWAEVLIQVIPRNGTVTYKPRRQQRRQRAQAHNSTPNSRQQSFMYWLCSKQKDLLCTY